jgi:hypothetical protein
MIQGYEFFNLVKAQCHMRQLMNNAGDTILAIEFPEGDKVRSRTVVSRSRARPTGKYPSWKMGRMIQWESHNELNAFRLLDANPAAVAYHEQPLTIKFVLNGDTHIHYPDVLVQWGDSRELWEIKPESEAVSPQFAQRTRFLESAMPKLGFAYRMVIAEDLAKEPRLSNVLTFLKYGRSPICDVTREHIRLILESNSEIYWSAATSGDLGPNGRGILARLILEGVLSCDMETALSPSSCFRPGLNRPRSIK